MFSNAGLGKALWAEAVAYECHLISRLLVVANGGKTPIEVWFGKPATNYYFLHVFGCFAYFHVKETKLDPRSKKAIFLGFSTSIKGYRLWCRKSKKISLRSDFTFDESVMLKQKKEKNSQEESMKMGILHQVEFDALVVLVKTVQTIDSSRDD